MPGAGKAGQSLKATGNVAVKEIHTRCAFEKGGNDAVRLLSSFGSLPDRRPELMDEEARELARKWRLFKFQPRDIPVEAGMDRFFMRNGAQHVLQYGMARQLPEPPVSLKRGHLIDRSPNHVRAGKIVAERFRDKSLKIHFERVAGRDPGSCFGLPAGAGRNTGLVEKAVEKLPVIVLFCAPAFHESSDHGIFTRRSAQQLAVVNICEAFDIPHINENRYELGIERMFWNFMPGDTFQKLIVERARLLLVPREDITVCFKHCSPPYGGSEG